MATIEARKNSAGRITEFLEARIAEDESDHYPYNSIDFGHYLKEERFGCVECGIQEDRTCRTQRECAAKRAIIAAHKNQEDNDDDSAWIVASEVLLRALAAVYASHPDYRQEWAL